MKDFRVAIEALITDGMLFSTIDDLVGRGLQRGPLIILARQGRLILKVEE